MKPISMIGIGAAVTRRPLPRKHPAPPPRPLPPRKANKTYINDRQGGGGPPPPPATPPCVRVRTRRFELVTLAPSINVGSPRDLKYALESPTHRAVDRARYQGPRPLPAVLLASRGRTPSCNSAARRRRGVFHCRHRAARSRRRTQRVR